MSKSYWMAVLLALTVGSASGQTASGQTAEPAGMVKNSQGAVSIERSGERLPGSVGAQVFAADKIRTGADGAVGITLRDDTLLSAGPNSVLSLDHFSFNQTTHTGAMVTTVKKGTLSVTTGKLARQSPESVEFRTPTSILGVRGTEFAIEVIGGND